jgi:hypothetical protein
MNMKIDSDKIAAVTTTTGKSSPDNLAKRVGVGAVSRPWILAGEQSSLLTHIVAMESVSLCVRMKS